MSDIILSVEGLKKHYPVRGGVFSAKRGSVKAVEDVSFEVRRGETLGLVGESGCGKSTLGRNILRLEEPTAGRITFEGVSLLETSPKELFNLRRDMQMIFQDPYSSLNPRLTIGEIVVEPLNIHKIGPKRERMKKVEELLEDVGLRPSIMGRYPHEFSGGQRQRIGVARALALDPKLIIADEPLSALDLSVQAQVINLMLELQREHCLTYIFISHDLSVVEYISDTIAVMYLGRIVETGPKEVIFEKPTHPYTRALIDSAPIPDPSRNVLRRPIKGEPPSAVDPPGGCSFHPRCPYAIEQCAVDVPPLAPLDAEHRLDHRVACIRSDEIEALDAREASAITKAGS